MLYKLGLLGFGVTSLLVAVSPHMLLILPLFGFFTLGIHAGFAIYFPELFPDHLRATGTGFCFNGGRLLAAPPTSLVPQPGPG